MPQTPGLPSSEAIRRALAEFQLVATDRQVSQIQLYTAALLRWNDKINLTAIRDPTEILYRHFCESFYGVKALPVEKGRLADVGAGAGFPGLPLKIMRPEMEVLLIESNVKKATFLAEVVRELRLTGARVLVSRYEELGEEVAPLDYVCARALGDFGPFLRWAASERVGAKNVVLWVGGRDLDEVRSHTEWSWREPLAIPHSLRRYILCGQHA